MRMGIRLFAEVPMKRAVLLFTAMLLCSRFASADACLPGNLQGYIDLGPAGCQIDDKTFFNFDAPTPFPTTYGASDVQITPIATSFNPGLEFTLVWPPTHLDGGNVDLFSFTKC